DDRARRRGHDADAAGEPRQRPLAGRVEEALLLELLLQLLEGLLERALAERLEHLHRELVLAAGRVDAEAAADHDLHAVLGAEADEARGRLPHHGPDLRLVVLEGEIPVAGRREAEVADLALDPHVEEIGLEDALDALGQLGDGEGAARQDRKSTRLNSSHGSISYAVFSFQ